AEKENISARIVISTWQSIYKMPAKWYNQFGVLIGDEAHRFAAKSLIKIMTNASNIKYRFGMSGTLSDSVVNELVLRGLFGDIYKGTTTAKLIERKELSK